MHVTLYINWRTQGGTMDNCLGIELSLHTKFKEYAHGGYMLVTASFTKDLLFVPKKNNSLNVLNIAKSFILAKLNILGK